MPGRRRRPRPWPARGWHSLRSNRTRRGSARRPDSRGGQHLSAPAILVFCRLGYQPLSKKHNYVRGIYIPTRLVSLKISFRTARFQEEDAKVRGRTRHDYLGIRLGQHAYLVFPSVFRYLVFPSVLCAYSGNTLAYSCYQAFSQVFMTCPSVSFFLISEVTHHPH